MKIKAVKRADGYLVYQDPITCQPLQAPGPDSAPVGGIASFMTRQAFCSEYPGWDVEAWPGVEEPKQLENIKSQGAKKRAAEIVAKETKDSKPEEKQDPNTASAPPAQGGPPPEMFAAIAAMMAGQGKKEEPEVVPVELSISEERALEFLKRIRFAAKYASEENAKTLQIQEEIVEQLIEEIFS